MQERRGNAVLDILIVLAAGAVAALIPPLTALLPMLAVSLDARGARYSATAAMGIALMGLGGRIYGPLGILAGAAMTVIAYIALFMLHHGVSHMDGLLYIVVGSGVTVVGCTALLTQIYGNLTEILMNYVSENPALFSQTVTYLAVLNKEGITPEFFDNFVLYSGYDYGTLLEYARGLLSTILAVMTPTFIFGYGLTAAVGAWMVPGYRLRAYLLRKEALPGYVHLASLPPAFTRWSLPRYVTLPLLILYVITLFLPANMPFWLQIAAPVSNVLVYMAFGLQGAAMISFFLERRRARPRTRWIVILCLLVLFPSGLYLSGMFDTAINLRVLILQQENFLRQNMPPRADKPTDPASGPDNKIEDSPWSSRDREEGSEKDKEQKEDPPEADPQDKDQKGDRK